MKFAVVVLACLVAAAHAQFNYNRASAFASSGFGGGAYKKPTPTPYRPTPAPYRPTPAPYQPAKPVIVKVSSGDASADTVKYGNEVNPDGSYNYFYETTNGIAAQAQGIPRDFGGNPPVVADVVQGSYSFFTPEGNQVAITYTADENGYQPQGDAIPTSPPVPEAILRSLEYIARAAPRQ